MARGAKTDSFVTEIELLPTTKQAKRLRSKFETARQVYKAALEEARKTAAFDVGIPCLAARSEYGELRCSSLGTNSLLTDRTVECSND